MASPKVTCCKLCDHGFVLSGPSLHNSPQNADSQHHLMVFQSEENGMHLTGSGALEAACYADSSDENYQVCVCVGSVLWLNSATAQSQGSKPVRTTEPDK